MRPARASGLLAAVTLAISGCSRNYVFEDLRGGFQQSELPAVFANGNRHLRVSGHASFTGQKDIGFSRISGYAPDTTAQGVVDRPVYGEYQVKRDPASFGGSVMFMGNGPFAGLAAGFSSPHQEFWHMGFVGGWSRRLGPFTPMISAGSFYNHFSVRAKYWSETSFLLGGTHSKRDSSSMYVEDVSWPLKLGLMAHAGPYSPYMVIGRAATRFWPYSQHDDGGDYTVETREFTAGCRLPMPDGMSVSFEAIREWSQVSGTWTDWHWGGRMRIELERF